MPENQVKKRHLRVEPFHKAALYKSKKRGTSSPVPPRTDFAAHGRLLKSEVAQIQSQYALLAETWEGNEDIRARGISVELQSAPGVEIDIERLEKNDWELLNERSQISNGQVVNMQTWFVPDGKLAALASILDDYLSKQQTVKGGRKQPLYRPLIDAIERVGMAAARQLWTETKSTFPENLDTWFEVWLRRGATEAERVAIVQQFKTLANSCGIRVGNGQIKLPEHTIIAAYGKGNAFAGNLALLSCISELRLGRDYADFFTSLKPSEQADWARLLLPRIEARNPDYPYVSVMDTGVNRGHPLLESWLTEEDNLTIEMAWSAADDDEHGTLMAGLCLYGDLTPLLASLSPVEMPVNIEGVKIVPPEAAKQNSEKLAGAYTAQGVALAEGKNPNRKRVWCVATSMNDPNDPVATSWSAQMDALACGLDNEGDLRRLICLSAGNIPQGLWKDYPQSNYDFSVENPAQSWNPICVGAYTEFTSIRFDGAHTILAPAGGLAPVSSTSFCWDKKWPNKPDIVFEGGNAVLEKATNSTLTLPELQPLSTHPDFNHGVFGSMSGTSASTAFAARMAGQILKYYPELTPESVRGLMIHSAEWTEAMKSSIPNGSEGKPLNKRDRSNFLLRTVGYGVPQLQKAIECGGSRATLIAECEMQPFQADGDKVNFHHMHLHELPWPKDALRSHSQEQVRMRVTLSYFIEPNPGNRGHTSHFRYANCALRFKVSSPGQSAEDLAAQVSKLAAEELKKENRVHVEGSTNGWLLGDTCFKGSVHSDIWEGTAADLLSMQHIAISPVTGWWRTRPSNGRANSKMRYSLIVTLEAQNPAIDIYTEIESQIRVPVTVDV